MRRRRAQPAAEGLGADDEIRRWLEEERDVPQGLEIVDREPNRDTGPFSLLRSGQAAILSFLGLDPSAASLPDALMREAAGPMAGMNIPGMPKLF